MTACDGAWLDPTTGYLWENPPSDALRNWDDAVSYCDALPLCGYAAGAWHLPDIEDLRSLIRGCPDTMMGGACGVTDSCLSYYSCWTDACLGCTYRTGPGTDGCYWDGALAGSCDWHWSSSSAAEAPSGAWLVAFSFGGDMGTSSKTLPSHVRCVHRDP